MPICIHDNFLPHELYIECFNYAISKYNSHDMVFKTNNAWKNSIVQDSNPILIHTLDDTDDLSIRLKSRIVNNNELTYNICTTNLSFYFYTSGSHIPWHDDGNHNGGITIYLNKEWKDDWGGALLYRDNNSNMIDGGFYPKQNRAIIITDNIPHTVVPTTQSSDIRISIQCFFTNTELNNSK
tara:strand:+ start:1570 stop:2115 length:546 start_codon:yes stop_codon:yes gene_type:complete